MWLGARLVLAAAITLALYQALPVLFDAWDTEQTVQWWSARATGFVAYVAFTLSMLFGLMVTSRGLDGDVARASVLEHHQQWTLAAMIATVAHILVIVTDDYVTISVADALVPGLSTELTGPIALGAVTLWVLGLITVSSWIRGRIPFLVWRVLHTAALGGFILMVAHAFTAGTDSDLVPAQLFYVITLALVVGATVFRFAYFAHRSGALQKGVGKP